MHINYFLRSPRQGFGSLGLIILLEEKPCMYSTMAILESKADMVTHNHVLVILILHILTL